MLPGVFKLASTNGIMAISFALFCIIMAIGAGNGRCTFVFIYPDRLLKFASTLCEWQNLKIDLSAR